MKTVRIIGLTSRLRQLIRNHGNKWEVVGIPVNMNCFNNGIGVPIKSLDGTHERNVPLEAIENYGILLKDYFTTLKVMW